MYYKTYVGVFLLELPQFLMVQCTSMFVEIRVLFSLRKFLRDYKTKITYKKN